MGYYVSNSLATAFVTVFDWIQSKIYDWLINWCLKPTLAIVQLYRGVNKFIINLEREQNTTSLICILY